MKIAMIVDTDNRGLALPFILPEGWEPPSDWTPDGSVFVPDVQSLVEDNAHRVLIEQNGEILP